MPSNFFAERPGNERGCDDAGIDEDVINLKRICAAIVAGWVKRADLAGEIAFETTDPVRRQVSAMRKVTSNAIRKWPSAMSEAPIVMVKVRPSQRSAIKRRRSA